jgi:hypothetical protein
MLKLSNAFTGRDVYIFDTNDIRGIVEYKHESNPGPDKIIICSELLMASGYSIYVKQNPEKMLKLLNLNDVAIAD